MAAIEALVSPLALMASVWALPIVFVFIGGIWADVLETLPAAPEAALGHDTEAARLFRSAMVKLWTRTQTFERVVKEGPAPETIAVEASLSVKVAGAEEVFEAHEKEEEERRHKEEEEKREHEEEEARKLKEAEERKHKEEEEAKKVEVPSPPVKPPEEPKPTPEAPPEAVVAPEGPAPKKLTSCTRGRLA